MAKEATLHIRRAGQQHSLLLAEMGARTFQAAFGPDNDPEAMRAYIEKSFSTEKLDSELADPASTFLLAYQSEKPIGYSKLVAGSQAEPVVAASPVELERIYIEPHSIGKGYGSQLLQACLSEAARAGHDVVWLGVWERNPRAIRFYERWNFRKVGSHTFLLGNEPQTDLLLQRSLTDLDQDREDNTMKSNLPALMASRDLDALLVLGDALHNPAMVYFTGVTHVTEAVLVLKRGEEPVLFFHPMEREEAASTGLNTRPLAPYDYRQLFEESGKDARLAKARLLSLVLGDVGVTSGRVAVYGQRDAGEALGLINTLRELLPNIDFIGEVSDTVLMRARATKDAGEIAQMRQVGKHTVEVVAQVAHFLSQQRAEKDVLVDKDGQPVTVSAVKRKIFLWLAERGLDNPHGTIFAPGAEGAVPHSTGSPDALLRLGEPIVFDIFPVQAGGGYYFDFTRTWCLGYASEEAQALYDDVRDVYEAVIGELEMDKPCSIFHDRACELFAQRGHPTVAEDPQTETGFVHGLAHGLGLDVHEAPRFSGEATDEDILRAGSVVTIEPGLYYPERGLGCRIEDAVYVRPDGTMEILAPYPLDLVIPIRTS